MFGIGNLFDPMKMGGMSLFGGPQPSGGPSWGPITPPGGKPTGMLDAPPNGMLRAGDDDMRPPPLPGGTGALNLAKAGGEGPLAPPNAGPSRGLSIGAAPPIESSAALHPPTPMAGITTPSLSPQYTPTPPQPGEGAGGLRTQYDAPAATPAPAGGAAGPGAAIPSTAATATSGAGGMGKLGDIGKALSAAGGQQAGKAAGFAPGGVGAAHTPDGSALMAKIMEAQTVTPVGPVPGLPVGLLQRFKGGG